MIQYQIYILSNLDFNKNFYICLFLKQILLLSILLNYIIKVIQLLYKVLKINIIALFAYHLHYKEELIITKSIYNFFLF